MSVTSHPRVKRTCSIIGHSADVVEVRSGVWNPVSVTLTDDTGKGKLFSVVSGLDGTISRRDLARREGVSRVDVEGVIDHLVSLGLVEEAPASALDEYVDQIITGSPAQGGAPRLRRVVLLGDDRLVQATRENLADLLATGVEIEQGELERLADLEGLSPDVWHDGLKAAETIERFAAWRGAFVIAVYASINPLRLQSINRLCLGLEAPWLHGALDGPFVFVGPTVVPGQSACYECFESRVTANLRESGSYLAYKNALARGAVVDAESPVLRPVSALLSAHVALEAVNFLTTGTTVTVEKVLGIHLPTMEIAYSEVLPMPGCAACGSLPGRDDRSLTFDVGAWAQ